MQPEMCASPTRITIVVKGQTEAAGSNHGLNVLSGVQQKAMSQ